MTKRCVVSALIGGYENLTEQPAAAESDVDFILFTDNESLTSESWQVRPIELPYPMDLVRSSRRIKVLAHEYLPEYQESLWVDNSVLLLQAPDPLFGELLTGRDISVPRHSYREELIDEFLAVAAAGLDDPARVYEQLTHYSTIAADLLSGPVGWTGLLPRRHSEPVIALMRAWFEEILRYSRRDQLSLAFAAHRSGVPIPYFELDNFASPYHNWPASDGRLGEGQRRAFQATFMPPVAGEAAARDEARAAAELAQVLSDRVVAHEEQRLDFLRIMRQLKDQLDHTSQEREAFRSQLDEMRQSTSWKVTKPIRSAKGAAQKRRAT